MSVEAMAWALNVPVENPIEKLVLIGLANHADKYGRDAFPSVQTLSEYVGRGPRTIQRVLRDLQDRGLIVAGDETLRDALIQRKDRRPNVYNLPINGATPASPRSLHGVTNGVERGVTDDQNGASHVTPEPSLNPPLEPWAIDDDLIDWNDDPLGNDPRDPVTDVADKAAVDEALTEARRQAKRRRTAS